MGDFKDESKKIVTTGATAGTLIYTIIALGVVALVILLLIRALM